MINLRDLNKEERVNTLIEHHFNYNSALSSISSVSFIDSHTSIDELKEFLKRLSKEIIK